MELNTPTLVTEMKADVLSTTPATVKMQVGKSRRRREFFLHVYAVKTHFVTF